MRIVVTMGPACATLPGLAVLRAAGADDLRLNGSHLDTPGLSLALAVAERAGFTTDEIILDIQGGKTRLGAVGSVDLRVGDKLVLGCGGLEVDRPAFLSALRVGDILRVDDGRIALEVEQILPGNVGLRALDEGRVLPRKGLALVGRDSGLPPELLTQDCELIACALAHGVRRFAVSYANTPALIACVREKVAALSTSPAGDASADEAETNHLEVGGRGNPGQRKADASACASGPATEIIAKIEHPLAVERRADLADAADGIWLCRGDLGAEAGLEHLPHLHERVLSDVLGQTSLAVAGQLLHHLTVSERPTRSEVCHLADLARRGVDVFVLSDETATGPNGPAAVGWLRRILGASISDR